jgi:hypothetical protein
MQCVEGSQATSSDPARGGNGLVARMRASRVLAAPIGFAAIVMLTLAFVHGASADAPGCISFGSGCVTVVSPNVSVGPSDNPTGTTSASLVAPRNDVESFQVVVHAGATPINGLKVDLNELPGSPGYALSGPGGVNVPTSNITIYREENYNVTTPSDLESTTGLQPDPLIPTKDYFYGEARNAFTTAANGFTLDVPANQSRVAWVDVIAPWKNGAQDFPAGSYSGSIAVTASGTLPATVNMGLDLKPFSIPSEPTLTTVFDMDTNKPCPAFGIGPCLTGDAATWQLYALFVRAALENRVSLAKPGLAPGTNDKALFEQYVLPMVIGSAQSPVRLPGAREGRIFMYPFCDAGCIGAWKAESEAPGGQAADRFDDRLVYYACDEPYQTTASWTTCRDNITSAHTTWPGVPTALTGAIKDADDFGGANPPMRDLVNNFIPITFTMHGKPGDPFHNRDRYLGDQSSTYTTWAGTPGNKLWMYTACDSYYCGLPTTMCGPATCDSLEYFRGWSGYAIDEPPIEERTLGWLSYKYGSTGEYYFEIVNKLMTAWTDQYSEGGNGDGTLFYPGLPAGRGNPGDANYAPPIGPANGHAIPIESMRLKRIRDAREDYELLNILKNRGGADKTYADNRVKTLFGVTQSTDNAMWTVPTDADLTQARLDLINQIDAGLTSPPGPPANPSATAGDESASVSWTPPASDGGSPITNYIVTPYIDSAAQTATTVGNVTSTTITGLTNGITYTFKVAAKNTAGTGPPSANSNAVTPTAVTTPSPGKIAFASTNGGDSEVYVMNADGSNPTPLTANAVFDGQPAWSPNGSRIAFTSARLDGFDEIYVMKPDGSDVKRVTIPVGADDSKPAWSPTGNQIAFTSNRDGNNEIYVMNGDGSGATNVTNNPANDDDAAWTANGNKIVFASTRPGSNGSDLWQMDANGSNVTHLTNAPGDDDIPDWSSDGANLAFDRFVSDYEVYSMKADGSALTNLSMTPAFQDYGPSWSMDGSRIAFTSTRTGNGDIYVMDANGNGQTRLTTDAAAESDPDWSPPPVSVNYPRPGSGSPLRVPLVPEFQKCAAPNTTHTGPLNRPSCNPAVQESGQLTTSSVGKGGGLVRVDVLSGNPSTPADEADVNIFALLTDVRKKSDGSDYAGKVILSTILRITDRSNDPQAAVSATGSDIEFSDPIDCLTTTNTAIGASCNLNTTADALVPGFIKEDRRMIVSVLALSVRDAGPDGAVGSSPPCPPTCGTGDEQVFERQGIFAP